MQITKLFFLLALVFRLRESNRVVDEGNGFFGIEVSATEVELASDISLVLTPMIAPEDFRPLPDHLHEQTLVSWTFLYILFYSIIITLTIVPGRIDFSTEPVTLNFMAGGPIVLSGNVPINDDMIDEALEYFVATLDFLDPNNVPPLTSIEGNGGDIIRIDIIDNDGELKNILYRWSE